MNKKWMPITAGVLDILYGAFGVLWGLLTMALGTGFWLDVWGPLWPLLFRGVFMTVIGVLAVAGGVFILTKRRWPLATVGAFIAIIPAFYLWNAFEIFCLLFAMPAIVAVVLTILSRKQFEK